VADAPVLEAFGMRGQRVGQSDLVDHSHVEADVHSEHAQVGEEHGVRSDVVVGGVGRRRERGHHVPHLVIARG